MVRVEGEGELLLLCQERHVTDQQASIGGTEPWILWLANHQIRFECVCTTPSKS
jgi:hypothetical protein